MKKSEFQISADVRWLVACVALAVGEALGFACARFGACWPVAAALAAFCALFGYALRVRGWRFAFAILLGLALALGASASRNAVLDAARACGGSPLAVVVRASGPASVRRGANGTEWMSFRGSCGALRMRVVAPHDPGDPLPARGERWQCSGWLDRDACGAWAARTLWSRGRGTSVRRLPDDALSRLAAHAEGIRSRLSRRVGLGLGGDAEAAGLSRAMLLGERASLPVSLRDDFVAAGTVHVFAVSGLHVMVVAHVMLVLLLLAGVPYRAAGIALAPALWAYVFVVGFPPSAVRAALMASFYYAAPFFWRRQNALVAWSAAFLCVHIASPAMLMDVGSRFSFVVMLALVAWGRTRRPGMPRWADVVSAAAVSWAAGVPIAAETFGRITAGGLLANLAVVPAAGVGVAASAAGCLASFVSETLAGHVNNLAALAMRAMSAVSRAVASVPGASVDVAPWNWLQSSLWYVALALAIWLAPRLPSLRRRGFA